MALAERLNIDFDDVAVIGDNHNDLSMFECFGNSAAMGKDVYKRQDQQVIETLLEEFFILIK